MSKLQVLNIHVNLKSTARMAPANPSSTVRACRYHGTYPKILCEKVTIVASKLPAPQLMSQEMSSEDCSLVFLSHPEDWVSKSLIRRQVSFPAGRTYVTVGKPIGYLTNDSASRHTTRPDEWLRFQLFETSKRERSIVMVRAPIDGPPQRKSRKSTSKVTKILQKYVKSPTVIVHFYICNRTGTMDDGEGNYCPINGWDRRRSRALVCVDIINFGGPAVAFSDSAALDLGWFNVSR
ncbi:hypothetical protein BDZ97DRAFT_2057309 [Flammula alnicola]|nr:hypothetical protein BDZ97DRAFT_2057309 [Flammula alnicola]